jgi:peptidoglycan/LPS O-acetylase OafA/YrhL
MAMPACSLARQELFHKADNEAGGMIIEGETATGVPITSPKQQPGELQRLKVLDSFRALAIFFVMSYHYTVRWAAPHDPTRHLPPGEMFNGTVLQYGWIGVEFFFMISGFVILMTLERCHSVADFFVRRFARLWPALFVTATLSALFVTWAGPADWQLSRYDYLTSVFFMDPEVFSRITGVPGLKWVDGAYWSLRAEIRFYVFAGMIFWLFRKNLVVVWVVVMAAIPFNSLYHHLVPLPRWHFSVHILGFETSYLPFFSVGVFAYELWSRGKWSWLAWIGLAITEIWILALIVKQHGVFGGSDTLAMIIINAAMMLLVVLFIFDSVLLRPLCWTPLVMVGQASYSLYLIHQNIGVIILRHAIDVGIPYLLAIPGVSLAMIGMALLLFRYVEIPAKGWILRLGRGFVALAERFVPGLVFTSKARMAG